MSRSAHWSSLLTFPTVLAALVALLPAAQVDAATPLAPLAASSASPLSKWSATSRMALAGSGVGLSGCGALHLSGSDTLTMQSAGLTRDYIVHVPSNYTVNTATPLILNLHAYTSSASAQERLSGMDTYSDQSDVLVAYPDGTKDSTGNTGWNVALPGNPANVDLPSVLNGHAWTSDDRQFLADLVNTLEAQFCVDTARISVTGYSMGGIMSFALACNGAPWLAAIEPVASTPPWGTNAAACPSQRPVSVEAFHGQKDMFDVYNGNQGRPALPSVLGDDAAAQGCPVSATQVWSSGDVVETAYQPCHNPNVQLRLYSVTDGGHTWPGSPDAFWLWLFGLGTTTNVINASQLAVQFTQQHPRQTAK